MKFNPASILSKTPRKLILACFCVAMIACQQKGETSAPKAENEHGQPVYTDRPFIQDYSIRYYLEPNAPVTELFAVSADRNYHIHVLSDKGILVPGNGSLMYPGKLVPDKAYTQMLPKNIRAMATYQNHTVYLDNAQVFSNGWAGSLQIDHQLPGARIFAPGNDFHFLVSDGNSLRYLDKNSEIIWEGTFPGLKQIKFQPGKNRFLLVSANEVAAFIPGGPIHSLFEESGITYAEPIKNTDQIAIGTTNGYFLFPEKTRITRVPCPEINCITEIDGTLWFGSANGAWKLSSNGENSYYAGERWIPGNDVKDIQKGPENSLLVATDKGLGQIFFQPMTLEEKARFFEKQVRAKNIRYGFNCSQSTLNPDYSSATMNVQPSDNLWTGMYLASQLFRYKVTGEAEARQNALEAFEAMERLHTVTGIEGLFARSFERDYKIENTKTEGWQKRELQSGSPATLWLRANDHPNWTWRSTASSDQTVGQIFALTTVLELADDSLWKQRALNMLDHLMTYIVDNDMYIIDVDGQPTMWGKWNPDYVNSFPTNVGDRKLYSSNIVAFLQTAYQFTGNEKYKTAAYGLMEKHGYLENLLRPFSEIGPSKDDELSAILSHEWNHSDDEMYFLAYWGLYPYAFTPELKEQFNTAIKDHWEMERPEKNALWNFTYAMTGAPDFDLTQSIEFLQQYPMDLRNWKVENSQRKDIELIPDNFRGQTTTELLPLGEIPLYRHNGQIFELDREGNGQTLISAGDVWLLPYWMGRYLGVISAPENK
ncbi:hypothetical protein INQ51_00615 [Maribellus sp. CM-23]|uniref:hypothetical protein n=1 Tax=Maribellus sp. CM-23 TaxID=2781026 RepID=UPI001F32C684|nr:hypothetical protein [Maribellus sp. CM-23]MCE4562796.1 hypothetical protein [Maribellus sp. CM-23]